MYGSSGYGTTPYGSFYSEVESGPVTPASLSITFRVSVVETEDIVLPLTVTRVSTQDIDLPLRVSVVIPADIELPFLVSVIESFPDPRIWIPVVRLGGVDISALLTSKLTVSASEGEARIADFTIQPSPGALSLPQWVGEAVEIDFAEQGADGSPVNPARLFTGVVDVPEYDFSTGLVSFACTDQLQHIVRASTTEWIDTNVGGFYTEIVTGEPADNLEYADARLATVPKSLDLDAFQQARVYDWHTGDAATTTLTENDIIYESLKLTMASRNAIQNDVTVGFRYRIPRLRARVASVTFGGDINAYTAQALDIPSRAMIEQACGSMSGWQLLGEINYVGIDPGSYGGGGGTIAILIGPADAPNLAIGFAARWAARWVQSVTESYELNVFSSPSIAALGRSRYNITGAALNVEFDEGGWLSDTSPLPALTYPIPVGDVSLDYGQAGKNDRTEAELAIKTSVAQAKKQILASHRLTKVGARVLLSAGLDLNQRIAFDTENLEAQGKVVSFTHTMDIDRGQADTEFDIAISGFSFVGLQEEDATEAPDAPVDSTPSPGAPAYGVECGLWVGGTSSAAPWDEAEMIGFSTNARQGPDFDLDGERYPFAMSVRSPEIESAVRDPITLPKAGSYEVEIPQDPFALTIP